MATPILHPISIPDGKGPGLAYRIEGQIVPTLHIAMNGSMPIMFEHHVILWKNPNIDINIMKLAGAFKRVIAGMPILMTQAEGVGELAFSRDNPGQVFPLHLPEGHTILVREHQFLAATGNVEYTFERVKGIGSMLFGSQGFFVDRFTGGPGGSIVWLHANGNAFDIDLAPGETIDVEPGAWVYREDSVHYTQQIMNLKTSFLGGGNNLIFNRFTGPGRVGIQSGYFAGEIVPAPGNGKGASALGGLAVGGILGGLLDS
jgi:uncharacterized protein (AIM24 family)